MVQVFDGLYFLSNKSVKSSIAGSSMPPNGWLGRGKPMYFIGLLWLS